MDATYLTQIREYGYSDYSTTTAILIQHLGRNGSAQSFIERPKGAHITGFMDHLIKSLEAPERAPLFQFFTGIVSRKGVMYLDDSNVPPIAISHNKKKCKDPDHKMFPNIHSQTMWISESPAVRNIIYDSGVEPDDDVSFSYHLEDIHDYKSFNKRPIYNVFNADECVSVDVGHQSPTHVYAKLILEILFSRGGVVLSSVNITISVSNKHKLDEPEYYAI